MSEGGNTLISKVVYLYTETEISAFQKQIIDLETQNKTMLLSSCSHNPCGALSSPSHFIKISLIFEWFVMKNM